MILSGDPAGDYPRVFREAAAPGVDGGGGAAGGGLRVVAVA